MRKLTLYPFLFAIFPILFLFDVNLSNVGSLFNVRQEIIPPIFVALASATALFGLGYFLFRDRIRAGVFVALWALFFYGYGPIKSLFPDLQHRFAIVLWTVIVLIAGTLLIRSARRIQRLEPGLNGISFCLFALATIKIAGFYLSEGPAQRELATQTLQKPEILPDVYYMIFDMYGREDVLNGIYNYDNTMFLSELKKLGFYVADRTQSNYAFTQLSLASSLNMSHLTDITDRVPKGSKDMEIPTQMIAHNRVAESFRQLGYKFITSTSYTYIPPLAYNTLADERLDCLRLSPFRKLLIESTAAYPFIKYYDNNMAEDSWGDMLRANTHCMLEESAKIAQREEPTFYFGFYLIPHPPFIFGEEGESKLSFELEHQNRAHQMDDLRSAYVAQLKYTNGRILDLIKTILKDSKTPPIIILQADHGPQYGNAWIEGVAWDKPDPIATWERMSVLNAYYLKGEDHKGLYPDITPVNSFRYVFNRFFGTNYPMLEDKSYFSDWGHTPVPFEFQDVTDELKRTPKALQGTS